jgi:formate dehydrogenase
METSAIPVIFAGGSMFRRLKPFDTHLHYTDRHRLPESVEKELGLTFHKSTADMVPVCDAVTNAAWSARDGPWAPAAHEAGITAPARH